MSWKFNASGDVLSHFLQHGKKSFCTAKRIGGGGEEGNERCNIILKGIYVRSFLNPHKASTFIHSI